MRRTACLLIGLLAAAPALADEDYCIDPRTRAIDPASTQALRQLLRTADPTAMQRMSGVWYIELPSPATSQISYLYQTFEPNGLYGYQNRVCGGAGCTDYQGTGLYALRPLGDGSYTGLIMVSDLHRNHQCTGLSGRFDGAGNFVAADGTPWRRVR